MKISRTARYAATAAIMGLALSGCSYINPVQTHYFYQSAEGAVLNFEPEGPSVPVGMRNFLVVEDEQGTKSLTGTITNQATTEYTVEISFADGASGATSLTIPAGETVTLGGDQPALEVSTQAKAGDNVIANITVNGETKPLTIQVLDTSLGYLGNE